MLKFTQQPKTPGMTSKKTLLSLKGISCLQVIFVLNWMKQMLLWLNLQRDGTGNGMYNIKDTFAESLHLQVSVLHQGSQLSLQVLRLVSQVHMMVGQNVKKQQLVCQTQMFQIKMFKQHATPNSSLHKLNIYSSKGCRKTS